MSRHSLTAGLAVLLLAGCAGMRPGPPVEMLDERTGITIASLQQPIALAQRSGLAPGRRPSFAWLGPVEWNRMGTYTQGLWVQVVQGQDQSLADIRNRGTLALVLDDGPLELQLADAPARARNPYRAVAPWGQAAYFSVTAHDLRRVAASSKLTLHCLDMDGSPVSFEAMSDARPVLGEYLQSRGLTGD